MAFQSVPETAEVATIYDCNNINVQMTFHARFIGGYSLADIVALANNCDQRVTQSFLPIQTQDALYQRTEVRGLESIVDLSASDQTGAGPGLDVARGMPNSVTLAIQRNSGLTGRSSRGRVFWLAAPDSNLDVDENFFTAAASIAIVSAINLMNVSLNLSGWLGVIVSRFTGGVQRPTGVTFPWVNTLAVNNRVDSRRDRMP